MDTFDNFKDRIEKAQKFFASFVQNTLFPPEKEEHKLLTAQEAAVIMDEFINLLADATKNRDRFIRRINAAEMQVISTNIVHMQVACEIPDFNDFVSRVENFTPDINRVRILFMDLADNSRYQQISNMENTLIQIKNKDAEVSNILKNTNSIASQISKTAEAASNIIEILDQQKAKSRKLLDNFNSHQTAALQHARDIKGLLDQSNSHMPAIKDAAELVSRQKATLDSQTSEAKEHHEKMADLTTRHEKIIADQTQKNEEENKTVQELIKQAQIALRLGAGAGLSGVFIERREAAADRWVKFFWIGLSLFASLGAILLGWYTIKDANIAPGVLIARTLLLLIAMAIATFAAKQYAKNKIIEEDYSYKSALVGSFPGLIAELEKADPKYREKYVHKFLDELLQDPQRERRQDPQKERQYDNRDISDALKEKVFNQPPGNS